MSTASCRLSMLHKTENISIIISLFDFFHSRRLYFYPQHSQTYFHMKLAFDVIRALHECDLCSHEKKEAYIRIVNTFWYFSFAFVIFSLTPGPSTTFLLNTFCRSAKYSAHISFVIIRGLCACRTLGVIDLEALQHISCAAFVFFFSIVTHSLSGGIVLSHALEHALSVWAIDAVYSVVVCCACICVWVQERQRPKQRQCVWAKGERKRGKKATFAW